MYSLQTNKDIWLNKLNMSAHKITPDWKKKTKMQVHFQIIKKRIPITNAMISSTHFFRFHRWLASDCQNHHSTFYWCNYVYWPIHNFRRLIHAHKMKFSIQNLKQQASTVNKLSEFSLQHNHSWNILIHTPAISQIKRFLIVKKKN